MKAKRKILTAATLSAFLTLAGAMRAESGGGNRNVRGAGGKNWHTRRHRSGKKGHKGGKKYTRSKQGGTTPPPK